MFKSINDLNSHDISVLRVRRPLPEAHSVAPVQPEFVQGESMNETGKRNPACGIIAAGLTTSGTVHYNLAVAQLTEEAIRRGEARLTAHGAL